MVSKKKILGGLGLVVAAGLGAQAIEHRKDLGELYGMAKKGYKGYRKMRDIVKTDEKKRLGNYRKWIHKEQDSQGANRWDKYERAREMMIPL